MEAVELRKKTDELERIIQKILVAFTEDVGSCNFNIDVTTTNICNSYGCVVHKSLNVSVSVTV